MDVKPDPKHWTQQPKNKVEPLKSDAGFKVYDVKHPEQIDGKSIE